MKEYTLENIVIACCIGIFGAVVNVANNANKAKRAARSFGRSEGVIYFVTSLFSGMLFGLVAIVAGDAILGEKISIIELWLAISIGTVLGWDGLTRLASRSVDAMIYAIKK